MDITKKRSFGIDIIKSLAIFSVINLHFFLHTKFYSTPIISKSMFIQSLLRWFFMSAVPLFILATGYLQNKKEISKKFYCGIFRIIVVFLLISVIYLIFSICVFNNKYTVVSAIHAVFSFDSHYGWYVNMFIGLFLLIPFLNLSINSLSKKQFELFILILTFLISISTTINSILNLAAPINIISLPDWWSYIYPLLYYFLGAYIYKYRPHVNKLIGSAVIILLLFVQTACLIWVNAASKLNNWFLSDYSSLFIVLQSVCIFLLLYDIDVNNKFVKSGIEKISSLTLEMYLLSYFFDMIFYKCLPSVKECADQQEVFRRYYLLFMPAVFIASFISAVIFRFIYNQALILINRFKRKAFAVK